MGRRAAYAYWYLEVYGHERVRLLDGGRKIWEMRSRPLTDETPQRPRTVYAAKQPDLSLRAFPDEVLTSIGHRNLIDVRSPREFFGQPWLERRRGSPTTVILQRVSDKE